MSVPSIYEDLKPHAQMAATTSRQVSEYRHWHDNKNGCLWYYKEEHCYFGDLILVDSPVRKDDKIGSHDLLHESELDHLSEKVIVSRLAAYVFSSIIRGHYFDVQIPISTLLDTYFEINNEILYYSDDVTRYARCMYSEYRELDKLEKSAIFSLFHDYCDEKKVVSLIRYRLDEEIDKLFHKIFNDYSKLIKVTLAPKHSLAYSISDRELSEEQKIKYADIINQSYTPEYECLEWEDNVRGVVYSNEEYTRFEETEEGELIPTDAISFSTEAVAAHSFCAFFIMRQAFLQATEYYTYPFDDSQAIRVLASPIKLCASFHRIDVEKFYEEYTNTRAAEIIKSEVHDPKFIVQSEEQKMEFATRSIFDEEIDAYDDLDSVEEYFGTEILDKLLPFVNSYLIYLLKKLVGSQYYEDCRLRCFRILFPKYWHDLITKDPSASKSYNEAISKVYSKYDEIDEMSRELAIRKAVRIPDDFPFVCQDYSNLEVNLSDGEILPEKVILTEDFSRYIEKDGQFVVDELFSSLLEKPRGPMPRIIMKIRAFQEFGFIKKECLKAGVVVGEFCRIASEQFPGVNFDETNVRNRRDDYFDARSKNYRNKLDDLKESLIEKYPQLAPEGVD